ncbi:hypothetical protein IG631_10881 [Alternaria alternata]|nr:hypothetical protein IG631_10881 [Alternaria alternata]
MSTVNVQENVPHRQQNDCSSTWCSSTSPSVRYQIPAAMDSACPIRCGYLIFPPNLFATESFRVQARSYADGRTVISLVYKPRAILQHGCHRKFAVF